MAAIAFLIEPKTPKEMEKIGGLSATRKEYYKLADYYNKVKDCKVLYCHKCNDFKATYGFYTDKNNASGYFPICKECIQNMALDYDKNSHLYVDNREKTIEVFRMMNIPFSDVLYRSALQNVQEATGEKNRATAFQQLITQVKSLPQWRGKTFADSEFDEDQGSVYAPEEKRTARKEIKKIFGAGFTESDYLYLQDQYDDWRARTQVDSKAQETYVMQICLQMLDIYKDRKAGRDVANKLKALDTLMNSANLQPKQNVGNASTDALTFGQLIEKWEEEKPIPEPTEEFKDVDGIGKYIRVWFTGWLSKALGLKNGYTDECEEYIKRYRVEKPEDFSEEGSAAIYSKIFGTEEG